MEDNNEQERNKKLEEINIQIDKICQNLLNNLTKKIRFHRKGNKKTY